MKIRRKKTPNEKRDRSFEATKKGRRKKKHCRMYHKIELTNMYY